MICVSIGRSRHKHMLAEFAHLVEHGAISEEELIAKLGGSARKARRFALNLEAYLKTARIDVRVSIRHGTKTYERV